MKQEEHFLGKVAQKAIIYHDGKVFLTRDPRTPDLWELPGGRLNVNEDPKEGLQRELKEELGITCHIENVVFSRQFRQGNENGQLSIVLVYTATTDPQAPIIADPREVMEFGWFSQEEISQMKLFPEYTAALQIFFTL